MTDDRRGSDRRTEDMRLAEAIAQFEGRYAGVDHHHEEVNRLIEVLEGKAVIMPSGNIVRDGGMISEVKALTQAMTNGRGVKIRIPTPVWVAIIVAIITGLFNVWAAIVSSPVLGG